MSEDEKDAILARAKQIVLESEAQRLQDHETHMEEVMRLAFKQAVMERQIRGGRDDK